MNDRPRRADAQRNRARLLEVAMRAFRQDGAEVSLEGIARQAGVGIGTLYRHFPTRNALVEAVYRSEIDRVLALADDLLAASEPRAALRAWAKEFVAFMATKRGMAAVYRAVIASGGDLHGQRRAQALDAIRALVAAGAAEGTVRADVAPLDVLTVLNGMSLASDDPEQLDRLLDFFMDGMRPAS